MSAASLWDDTRSLPAAERACLDGRVEADVAIVGAGYTGLWTAYYLLAADPTLRVVIAERDHAGSGASGRNGGWLSALLPMSLRAMAAMDGRDAAIAQQREMFATVDEVARVCAAEGIDCDLHKGGSITLARTAPQEQRLRAALAEERAWGFGEEDHRWLDADAARDVVDMPGTRGAAFTPHCAALHPAKLAAGLAAAAERRGATIFERSPVHTIEAHRVLAVSGEVRARVVVRATEAFTAQLRGMRRSLLPIYSLMIATEPLPDGFFAAVGLSERTTFADGRRLVVYGQRTADGRLAFGGRGAPYHFGSAVHPRHERDDAAHAAVEATLREMFPALGDARITHRWGGAVAAPRDWFATVAFDAATGLASAGGYVGDGVGSSNLAGRTLADLVTGRDSALTRLPWVGHRSRAWEPEPLRWLGVRALTRLTAAADRSEARTGRPDRWRGAILDRLGPH
jgi:glycine/D-amino acid oxidase-like deaminating enzyme